MGALKRLEPELDHVEQLEVKGAAHDDVVGPLLGRVAKDEARRVLLLGEVLDGLGVVKGEDLFLAVKQF